MNAWRLLYAETHTYMIRFSKGMFRINRDDLFLQLSRMTIINVAEMQGDLLLIFVCLTSTGAFSKLFSRIYRIQINKLNLLLILSMLYNDGNTVTKN